MIRTEKEYRHSEEQLARLRADLEELSRLDITADDQSVVSSSAVDALRMQIEDIEREMEEYKDLKDPKSGRLLAFEADELDSLGEMLMKARIARGVTQAELARELEMTQQQIQRYERDGYQKISLWRLAEIADALGLEFSVRARLRANDHRQRSYLGRTG